MLLPGTQVSTLCCCKHGTGLAICVVHTVLKLPVSVPESTLGKGASRVSGTVGWAGTGAWAGSLLRLPRGSSHPSGMASARVSLVRMSAMTYSEFHMVPAVHRQIVPVQPVWRVALEAPCIVQVAFACLASDFAVLFSFELRQEAQLLRPAPDGTV